MDQEWQFCHAPIPRLLPPPTRVLLCTSCGRMLKGGNNVGYPMPVGFFITFPAYACILYMYATVLAKAGFGIEFSTMIIDYASEPTPAQHHITAHHLMASHAPLPFHAPRPTRLAQRRASHVEIARRLAALSPHPPPGFTRVSPDPPSLNSLAHLFHSHPDRRFRLHEVRCHRRPMPAEQHLQEVFLRQVDDVKRPPLRLCLPPDTRSLVAARIFNKQSRAVVPSTCPHGRNHLGAREPNLMSTLAILGALHMVSPVESRCALLTR